jgi:hypothetical protein
MTIQQTIEIPASRRVYFDFLAPQEIPTGVAEVAITFSAVLPKPAVAGIPGGSRLKDMFSPAELKAAKPLYGLFT